MEIFQWLQYMSFTEKRCPKSVAKVRKERLWPLMVVVLVVGINKLHALKSVSFWTHARLSENTGILYSFLLSSKVWSRRFRWGRKISVEPRANFWASLKYGGVDLPFLCLNWQYCSRWLCIIIRILRPRSVCPDVSKTFLCMTHHVRATGDSSILQ